MSRSVLRRWLIIWTISLFLHTIVLLGLSLFWGRSESLGGVMQFCRSSGEKGDLCESGSCKRKGGVGGDFKLDLKEEKSREDDKSYQLVSSEESGDERDPVDSQYGGEKSQVVGRESVSRLKVVGGVEERDLSVVGKKREIKSARVVGKVVSEGELKEVKGDEGVGLKAEGVESDHESVSLEEEELDVSIKLPSFEAMRVEAVRDGALGVYGDSIDYLEDVEDGERTLLNRHRVRYASFFERVKYQVGVEWSPASVYMLRDPEGKRYSLKQRLTKLQVSIDGYGRIVRVIHVRSSGLEFLDAEAERAMRSAAPFANPPEGLKGEDGLVDFRFGFLFEVRVRKGIIFDLKD